MAFVFDPFYLGAVLCVKILEVSVQFLELLFCAVFQVDQAVAGTLGASNQFIELEMNRSRIAILSVLNQEHHQESNDRGARIDDQLPGVGEAEDGPRNGPHNENYYRADEGPWRADKLRGPAGDLVEEIVHLLLYYRSCHQLTGEIVSFNHNFPSNIVHECPDVIFALHSIVEHVCMLESI